MIQSKKTRFSTNQLSLSTFLAYLLISNICASFQPINISLSMYLQINDFGIKSHKAIL